MSLSGGINAIPSVDTLSQTSAAAQDAVNSPVASMMDAYSSLAGVTVRLLASLPANLGQNIDTAS